MNLCARIAVVATAALFVSNAPAQGIEIKGITLGEPESALERIYPVPGCEDVPTQFNVLGDRECRYPHSSYGGVDVQLTYYIFGGMIEAAYIYLKPDEFDAVIKAMQSRFGVPGSDRAEGVVTRAGVPYKNRLVSWKRGDGGIEGQRYSGTVSESVIRFFSSRYRAELAEREAAKNKASAGDL